MEDQARSRERGTFLVVFGAIILFLGLAGILGLECPSGFYPGPPGGGSIPACPSPLDYALYVVELLVGGFMVIPGGLLIRRTETS